MSLADELLADLEDGAEEDAQQEDGDALGVIPEVEEVVMEMDTKTESLSSIAKLRDSDQVCGFDMCPCSLPGHVGVGTFVGAICTNLTSEYIADMIVKFM